MSVPPGQLHKRNMHGAIMKYLGVWSATEIYKAGDVISTTDSFGKATYICVLANVNKTPPNDTYWIRNAPFGCCGDPVISVVATDAAGSETGPDNIVFTVTRGPDVVVNLRWDGTATYGTDYTVVAVGGTLSMGGTVLTMSAGAGTVTLTVTPIDDAIVEGPESVILTVGDGDGYSVGIATATGTIADNDSLVGILYVGRGQAITTSDLYTIDPLTGVCTSLGAVGHALTGLAVDPTDTTKLYFATSNNSAANPRSLGVIDLPTFPAGGSVTLIGSFGLASGRAPADIAFDAAGNLFGFAPSNGLCTVNKATGTATPLGAGTSGFGSGLGFTCDGSGVFWVFGSDTTAYATVDPVTGVVFIVGSLTGYTIGGGSKIGAASLDPSGVVYAVDTDQIVTIDTTEGIVSHLSSSSVSSLDAIAWTASSPPPRASIVLAGYVNDLASYEDLYVVPSSLPVGPPVSVTSVIQDGSVNKEYYRAMWEDDTQTKILTVFSDYDSPNNTTIRRMNADGSSVEDIFMLNGSGRYSSSFIRTTDIGPLWSSQSSSDSNLTTKIVDLSSATLVSTIAASSIDASGTSVIFPRFNQAGTRIAAFISFVSAPSYRLYTFALDGTGIVGPVITNSDVATIGVEWNIAGTKLMYMPISNDSLAEMAPDGTARTTVYTTPDGGSISNLRFSRDGSMIAFRHFLLAGGNTVVVLDASSYSVLHTISPGGQFDWSVHGSKIVLVTDDTINVYDLATEVTTTLYDNTGHTDDVRFLNGPNWGTQVLYGV